MNTLISFVKHWTQIKFWYHWWIIEYQWMGVWKYHQDLRGRKNLNHHPWLEEKKQSIVNAVLKCTDGNLLKQFGLYNKHINTHRIHNKHSAKHGNCWMCGIKLHCWRCNINIQNAIWLAIILVSHQNIQNVSEPTRLNIHEWCNTQHKSENLDPNKKKVIL